MPIEADKGPGGVDASYGRRVTSNKFDRTKRYDTSVFVDQDGVTYGPDGSVTSGGGLKNPHKVNNTVVVTYGSEDFGIFPVDAQGNANATVINRTGTKSSLLGLVGTNGELAIASDEQALVVYGVGGAAKEIRGFKTTNVSATDATAIGTNATVISGANDSVSIGKNARTHHVGQTAISGSISGIQTHIIHAGGRTTDATPLILTTDGLASASFNDTRFDRSGLYDVEFVVFAREIGTRNWVRFIRRAILDKSGSSTTLYNLTTPVADFNNVLTGVSIDIAAYAFGMLNVEVTGVAGKTIQWSAHITGREMSIVT